MRGVGVVVPGEVGDGFVVPGRCVARGGQVGPDLDEMVGGLQAADGGVGSPGVVAQLVVCGELGDLVRGPLGPHGEGGEEVVECPTDLGEVEDVHRTELPAALVGTVAERLDGPGQSGR